MSVRLGSTSTVCSVAQFDANDIHISVELPDAARFLLDFLSEISARPELCEGPLVECAIQRYERYWLPLVAKHPGRLLPAPLDIEWIWQCHMLSPIAYSTDCHNIAGKLIDHHLMEKSQRKELLKDSERLWRKEYADVPFSACDAVTPWFDCEFVSALTYNLTLAVSRQKSFYYQVSLPHYRDEKFLNHALLRYKKFLFLKCQNPGVFLVPCYDNDLMWHTHMLHPVFYKDDTEAYMGSILAHDDSVNDRSIGSKLALSEAKTRNLWRKVFSEKFSYFGAMYRGEPPYSKLYVMTKEDVYRVCTKQANVLIEKVRVSGLPLGKTFKLKLCYNTGYQNFNRSLFVTENIASVKGNARTLEDNNINAHFSFDTRYNDKIIASLQQKSGKLCLGTNDILGEGRIDMQKKIQPLNSKGLSANDDIDCGDGLSIGLVWNCPAPVLGPCVLRLEAGDYQSCVMPEDRETMWGPIPLPRLPPGVDNHCSVASHKLFNHTRRVVFTVRMIHSEPLLMSAIHVFYGDKLTVVAHLVVGDQLPLPSSVIDSKRCVTLNPKEGQRAVLIKNNFGDWGVAVGWWEGFQRRSAGRKGSLSEGHLEVRFFHLGTNKWHFVSFDRLYSLATSKFDIGDCVVEFDSGFIEINSERCEIAENLGLIFSVALIHVLCQPRPQNWAPQLSTPKGEEQVLPRLGGSEEIALLLAAGVLIATPCNHAIRNLFKKKKQDYGEGTSVMRTSQRDQDERFEHSGRPPVILHEAEVSAGWSEEWSGNNSGVSSAEAAVGMAAGLTMIKESEDDKEGSQEDLLKSLPPPCEDEIGGNELSDRTSLLRISDHRMKRSDRREQPLALCIRQESIKEEEEGEEEEEAVEETNIPPPAEEEGQETSDRNSGSVFEGEDYNLDADSQTGLFGNGESDSDEVEDDVDIVGFGRPSTADAESMYTNDQNHDSGSEVLPNSFGHDSCDDMVYENDTDYYDEFYGIGGDEHVNGYSGSDRLPNDSNHGGRGIWESYGDCGRNTSMENHTDYGGYGSYKDHAETSMSSGLFGGGSDCGGYSQGGGDHENGHSSLYCGGGDDGIGSGEMAANVYVDGGMVDGGGEGSGCGG
ncbi:glycine-rich domain-containing protein 2 [Biomphalaria glabrata]|uniref:Uncharacterized protein LOC106067059 isoform X1 n=1 Tax=Biomphalaria glabrata TaxID=6526 RepID=A0A9U8ECE3_BIOGL|nr:uncharacterized protein LOC106067059 isoform X1 [Biomphalaria glabrata]